MFALFFSFLFKDQKSFTIETVSSTPTMSRSSSISGVDMAGLQTSFLSQVLYGCNIGFFDVHFSLREALLMLKMILENLLMKCL